MAAIRTFEEFSKNPGIFQRLRRFASTSLAAARGTWSRRSGGNWLRFAFYHYVFDDQRAGFSRQLRHFRQIGQVITLDEAVGLVERKVPVDGRYLCITFDDGLANNFENALPILAEHQMPAAFFVATGYIGLKPQTDRQRLLGFHGEHSGLLVEFMDWEQCRILLRSGMTVGSHSVTHARLAELDATAADRELRESRQTIRHELGSECLHFCAPYGRPVRDFRPERDISLAQRAGYRSFHTTARGTTHRSEGIAITQRQHLLAHWPPAVVTHHLFRDH
ncbi:MAG: polysaccharide deacetylase family protein [Pseudomonadota bacterium]